MTDVIEMAEEAFRIAEIQHFTPQEFTCKCGTQYCDLLVMDMDFVSRLDQWRDEMDIPFRITSGYRCAWHPIEMKKTQPGPHRLGQAADIACVGNGTYLLLYGLGIHNAHGACFTGIGLNQKDDHDERFLHVDTCKSEPWRPRPHVWTY